MPGGNVARIAACTARGRIAISARGRRASDRADRTTDLDCRMPVPGPPTSAHAQGPLSDRSDASTDRADRLGADGAVAPAATGHKGTDGALFSRGLIEKSRNHRVLPTTEEPFGVIGSGKRN